MNDSVKSTLVEVYRIYVDSADRSRDRRERVHRFFLSLNLAGFLLIGYILGADTNKWTQVLQNLDPYLTPLPLVLGVFFSVPWYVMASIYRTMAGSKIEVIQDLEDKISTGLSPRNTYGLVAYYMQSLVRRILALAIVRK